MSPAATEGTSGWERGPRGQMASGIHYSTLGDRQGGDRRRRRVSPLGFRCLTLCSLRARGILPVWRGQEQG